MRKIHFVLLVCVILTGLFVAGCSSTPTTPAPTPTPEVHPGEALVANRCGTCHSVGVIQNAKYDDAGWKITVERMVGIGASLNAEQQTQVIDYLAKTYPKQ
jgi:hypothetical protein